VIGSKNIVVRSLVVIFSLCAARAEAQAPAVLRVEFDEAVRIALEKNPTVAQAGTNIGRAEALLRQAQAGLYPSAGASFANVTLDSARGFNDLVTQPQNQSSLNLNASYTFLQFAHWAAITQSKDQVDVAKFSAADVRRAIAVSTAEAYLSVIAAHRQVDVDERALTAARAHLDYAQRRLDAGAGSLVNQLRAAVEVSTDEARLEVVQFAVRRAQEALGVLLVANGPVDVGAEPVFDVPAGAADLDTSHRTDVQLEAANLRAAERVRADSKKDWFPIGSVSFDPQFLGPAGLFQPSKTWRLTVLVTQPIYDGGLRRAVARERDVAIESAKLSVASVDVQAKSEIRVAQESIQSFERASERSRLAAQQANEVLRITTTAFEVGATTNLEVIDAQRSARDADSASTLADDVVRRARLDLLVAMGRFPK
jgi:outer membrane protein TolC